MGSSASPTAGDSFRYLHLQLANDRRLRRSYRRRWRDWPRSHRLAEVRTARICLAATRRARPDDPSALTETTALDDRRAHERGDHRYRNLRPKRARASWRPCSSRSSGASTWRLR